MAPLVVGPLMDTLWAAVRELWLISAAVQAA